jgi:CHAT domain-containing protein
LTGWATEFMAAGAGAFVGTMWPIPSGPARDFALAFYEACQNDTLPLGEAIRIARTAIRSPDDPSWLAYTVYGDPNALVYC